MLALSLIAKKIGRYYSVGKASCWFAIDIPVEDKEQLKSFSKKIYDEWDTKNTLYDKKLTPTQFKKIKGCYKYIVKEDNIIYYKKYQFDGEFNNDEYNNFPSYKYK